ncbi:MAG: hypothetical protein [Caudoviricetes sp.]|nr:MAG: hypothetical protein [Caudoviricetes sp.]
MQQVYARSVGISFPDAVLAKGSDGDYWVLFGNLGFLKTSNYDEASEYYKACVTKQLETI